MGVLVQTLEDSRGGLDRRQGQRTRRQGPTGSNITMYLKQFHLEPSIFFLEVGHTEERYGRPGLLSDLFVSSYTNLSSPRPENFVT